MRQGGPSILRLMKTTLRLALVLCFAFAACACGNKGDLVLPDKPGPEASP